MSTVAFTIFRASLFSDRESYYHNQVSTKLATPTHDTSALLALIPELLPRIWLDEQRYQKGGHAGRLHPASMQQGDLFADSSNPRAARR
ncbi:DinB/UmuC family translesion DNA polymerase [Aeromonas veronii]|uniref:DinB/UmuC family translesion DNA polymerase n=1 Tax=Aeromonas veronii TaxID=654 RepID=UPI001F48EDCE|nr:hypothetical protein [Aeromonas veronii]